jgi:integrase
MGYATGRGHRRSAASPALSARCPATAFLRIAIVEAPPAMPQASVLGDNAPAPAEPTRKVAKPCRLPTTRRALPDARLAEINQIAATTGDDPELDTLILRLHIETACRRGGALALRPPDLDADQCLVQLREKGETVRWQPLFLIVAVGKIISSMPRRGGRPGS